jgi:hypothetical protein
VAKSAARRSRLREALVERVLNAELDHHLEGGEPDGRANGRNGYGAKSVLTGSGKLELQQDPPIGACVTIKSGAGAAEGYRPGGSPARRGWNSPSSVHRGKPLPLFPALSVANRPHAGAGGARSRPMSHSASANSRRGTATLAIWKVT